jgi:hypothetical protein
MSGRRPSARAILQAAALAILALTIAVLPAKPAAADNDDDQGSWYRSQGEDEDDEGGRGVYLYGAPGYYYGPPPVYYAPPPAYYYGPPAVGFGVTIPLGHGD